MSNLASAISTNRLKARGSTPDPSSRWERASRVGVAPASPPAQSKLLGIDLFSGAGGMSLGAERAGIRVALAVEADPHAATTYRQNHPDAIVLNQRIESIRTLPVGHDNSRLIIFGGPPCQGFSTSNQRTRSSANPLNWLFRHYVRIVRRILPEWVVFENVTGMVTTEGGRFTDEILRSFASAGYRTSHFILNAAEFGVPQRRSRLFITFTSRYRS
jgi:DNA (cytosine-5)-methyltransferase 1